MKEPESDIFGRTITENSLAQDFVIIKENIVTIKEHLDRLEHFIYGFIVTLVVSNIAILLMIYVGK